MKTPSNPTAEIWCEKDTEALFKSQRYLVSILNLMRSVNQMKNTVVLPTL